MRENEQLRVGIVGLGFGLDFHAPAFDALPGVSVVAFSDGGRGRLRSKLIERGKEALLRPVEGIFEDPSIDIVSIAAPPFSQYDLVRRAIASKKSVFCEKPLGTTLEQARQLDVLSRSSGGTHAVGFQFRYDPGFRALKEIASRGDLGEIRRLDVTWLSDGALSPDRRHSWRNDPSLGGGVLDAFVCHVYDYARWLCGMRIQSVFALGKTLSPMFQASGKDAEARAEDSVDILCEADSGAVASIKMSNALRGFVAHEVSIRGVDGVAVLREAKPFQAGDILLESETLQHGRRTSVLSGGDGDVSDLRLIALQGLIRDFVDAIRGRSAPDLPTFHDAYLSREALTISRLSMMESRKVARAEI